jgi:hypothetical protein
MNKTTDNPNTELDPQDETSALAHMTHEESEGYENSRECYDNEPMGYHDLSDDAQALASAGHGMDEDYHLDSCYESTCDAGE